MKKKLMMMAAALLVGIMSSYGEVIAAWDFFSDATGTLPAGWTTWSTVTLTSNSVSPSVNGLQLSLTATQVVKVVKTPTVMGGATPLMPMGLGSEYSAVTGDNLSGHTLGRNTRLTLSGLTPGNEYNVQFICEFESYTPTNSPGGQILKIWLDGVAQADVSSVGVGVATDSRLVISPVYTFTATDSDVLFTFDGSTTGNAGKNGLCGMIVDGTPPAETYYSLVVNKGTGDGSYTNQQQVQIVADPPAYLKEFDQWIGDTSALTGSVFSATNAVIMPASTATLTATYKVQDLPGSVVAAWDFSSARPGTVPAGWTTWSTDDMTNKIANTVGGLTISNNFTLLGGVTGVSFTAQQVNDTGVWSYVATPMLALGTNANDQYVYEDCVSLMLSSRAYTLALSGLTEGVNYQIQFVTLFMPYDPAQKITVKQNGVAAADIDSYGLGATTRDRVIYSDYYNVTNVTATNTTVTFLFDGGTTGNASKNGLCGMIVKQLGAVEPTLYTLTVNGGSGSGSSYTNGQAVGITADAPAVGYAFDQWTGDTQYVDSVTSATATVTMPAQPVTVTATYIATEQYTTNGTPYSWLDGYGLTNYVADDELDQDSDGLKTWQEHIANTIPTNAASVLKVSQTTRNTVTWIPQTGRTYSVYWSTNLVKGFTNLVSGLTHPQGSWTNTAPDAKVNHYQVKVQLP